MIRPFSLVAALLATILLTGCVGSPSLPDRPAAAAVTAFSLSGRLAVRQGEVRHHVKVDWMHSPVHDAILIATPLGQGVAELVRDETGARLVLADRRSYSASDWSVLAAQVFGFSLPLANASRWLLGDVSDTEGWRIEILERESAAPEALPTIIELERDDITVRLKIDEWSELQ